MKERGILYTPDNIRAIREGRKTQTRRLKGLEEINKSPFAWISKAFFEGVGHFFHKAHMSRGGSAIRCPYGMKGDRLYVKETFCVLTLPGHEGEILYKADGPFDIDQYKSLRSIWTSALFMPKKYARLWLEITDVRVERLQDISEADAIAEGIQDPAVSCKALGWAVTAKNSYRILWDSINEKGGHGWAVNDWVWVLTFKVIEP